MLRADTAFQENGILQGSTENWTLNKGTPPKNKI